MSLVDILLNHAHHIVLNIVGIVSDYKAGWRWEQTSLVGLPPPFVDSPILQLVLRILQGEM